MLNNSKNNVNYFMQKIKRLKTINLINLDLLSIKNTLNKEGKVWSWDVDSFYF